MNERVSSDYIRWIVIGFVCITVFGGIVLGAIQFSRWGQRISLAMAASNETGTVALPSTGRFDPSYQAVERHL
jgi:hypothetical protein